MTAMDHIVLNVENMETVLDFYTNVLGLEPERLEEFRQGKVGFPSVRINTNTVIDLFPLKEPVPATATPLRTDLNHFCLVVEKEDMPGFIDHLKAHGVTIEEGPGQRWGHAARVSPFTSVTLRSGVLRYAITTTEPGGSHG